MRGGRLTGVAAVLVGAVIVAWWTTGRSGIETDGPVVRRELGWHLGGTSGMALEGPEDADQLDSPGALATSDCRSGGAALVVFNADADLEVS